MRYLQYGFLPHRSGAPSVPRGRSGACLARACGSVLLSALLALVPPPSPASAEEGGLFIATTRPDPPTSATLSLPAPAKGPDTHPISDLFIENPPPAKPTPLPAGSIPPPARPNGPFHRPAPRRPHLPVLGHYRPPPPDHPVHLHRFRLRGQASAESRARHANTGTRPGKTNAPAACPDARRAPLDLNSATEAQLAALPGLDSNRARLIVAHRTAIRRFQRVDQLQQVFGISQPLFARVAPLLKTEPLPPPRTATTATSATAFTSGSLPAILAPPVP